MRKFFASAALALAFAGSAHAATTETVSVVVSAADLDLTSSAGKTVLAARIEAAAERVCGTSYTRDLRLLKVRQDCVQVAIANASKQADTALAMAARKVDPKG